MNAPVILIVTLCLLPLTLGVLLHPFLDKAPFGSLKSIGFTDADIQNLTSRNSKMRETFCGKDYPAAKLEEIKAAKCCPCSSVRPQEMDKCEDEYFKELPPADIRKKLCSIDEAELQKIRDAVIACFTKTMMDKKDQSLTTAVTTIGNPSYASTALAQQAADRKAYLMQSIQKSMDCYEKAL